MLDKMLILASSLGKNWEFGENALININPEIEKLTYDIEQLIIEV